MIALTDLRSETLAMLGIKVMAKLGGMTYWVESENRSRGKRKARSGKHDLMG